jgi:hypothetical protein
MPVMTCINKKPYIYRQERVGSITSSVDISHLNDIVQMIKFALDKSKSLNPQDKESYLSFYAVQYLTLLFYLQVAKEQNASDLLRDVYSLRIILDYDLDFKVKKANRFMKFFGYKLMTKALRLYVLNNKK